MCSFCTRLTESSPPPTRISTLSEMTVFAATAIAIIPDEHCRSTVMPAVVTGRPAASAACLPLLFIATEVAPVAADTLFALGSAWMGFLGGLNFPLAVALQAQHGRDPANAGPRLYATDLLGAAVGAIAIGALAIPCVGIGTSCRALAVLLIAAAIPLIVASRQDRVSQE